MQDAGIADLSSRVRRLLERRLGIQSRGLDAALRRARRQLPKTLLTDLRALVEAEAMKGHPRLMRRVDHVALERAVRDLEAHLSQVDLAEARKTRRLNLLAGLVFNLLLVGLVLLAVLRWRGFV